MTLSELKQTIFGSSMTALDILPSVGDEIDFMTPAGKVIEGALVTRELFFCGEYNYFVEYDTIAYDHSIIHMSGWVAQSDVV